MSGRGSEGGGGRGGDGRGRGRGRSNNNYNNNSGRNNSSYASRTGSAPTSNPGSAPATAGNSYSRNPRKEGGRGGGNQRTDAVDEDRRIFFKQQLLQFREGPEEEISFPSTLSATERKYIHRAVTELGLVSKSSGGGEDRRITVRRRNTKNDDSLLEKAIPWSLSGKAAQLLNHPDLQQALQELQEANSASSESKAPEKKEGNRYVHRLSHDVERIRASHKLAEHNRHQHAQYESIQSKRRQLPASHHRHAVVKVIGENQISLISGETGCGKSTQVPQYLLEDAHAGPVSRIVVTQPRRISAVSLAERIAFERSEEVGSTVGYNIRLESKCSAATQVLFVTPGVLLRKLIEDPELEEFSHVIVDEAHERDRYTEFLLILLRDICERRKNIKVVLMSATMHTHKLRAYFGEIPQVNVGGSVFPVQEFFLEHVLKFTNFTPPSTVGVNSVDISKWQYGGASYNCAFCDKGPFMSAEELGTHAALCFPKHDSQQPSNNNNKGSRQAKLQALSDRLKYVQYKVQQENPNADLSVLLPASSDSANGITIEDADFQDVSDSDPDVSGSDSDDGDDHDFKNQLVDTKDIGKEKEVFSEESSEFNTILKKYQESLQETDEATIDYDLLVSLLKYVFTSEFGQDGSVLVFLPGWDDISKLQRILSSMMEFSDPRKFLILQLHSGVPRKEQSLVFQAPKEGQRKIILSTNIAETSLTIDDVTVVINSGKVKEKVYDPHTNLSFLKTSFTSQASSRQRKGRAGRTRAGVCFHLFSVLRGKHLAEFQESELLRMPLEELVLQAKSIGVAPGKELEADSARSFLRKAMDPPHDLSVQHAIDLLQSLHCMDLDERLTELGQAISKLPMNPRLGKMLITGCMMGCGPAANNIAAVMSYRDPFVLATNDVQRARTQHLKMQFSNHSYSDQVSVYRALELFSSTHKRFGFNEARSFCDKHDLSMSTMLYLEDVCQQLNRQLQDIGIYSHQAKTMRNNGNLPLVTSLLNGGLYPGFAVRRNGASLFVTEKGPKAKIHPSSVNSKVPCFRNECKRPLDVVCFQELIALNQHQRSAAFGGPNYQMLGTSTMSVLSLLLTAGFIDEIDPATIETEQVEPSEETSTVVNNDSNTVAIRVDRWIVLKLNKTEYELIQRARELFGVALVHYVQKPEQSGNVSRALDRIYNALSEEQGLTAKIAAAAGGPVVVGKR